MRVLMFGWEFPPHIAGGLGTACYGMTRGLAKHGTEVIFVVPKAYGDEDRRFVHVVNASDVEVSTGKVIDNFEDFFNQAPQINPNVDKIKGVICGYRVEEIEEQLMQQIRYLDKLIDELAKGKAMDKILRS